LAVFLQEAAIMVTLPNNISQIIFVQVAAYVGDWAIKKKIPKRQTLLLTTARV